MAAPPPRDKPPPKRKRPELTRWKKILIGVATTFLVIGGCLQAFGSTGEVPQVVTGGTGASPNALVGGAGQPGPVQAGTATTESGTKGWAPFFFKGGFSFLVAFMVGFATRVWLKVAALILGSFCLGVLVLSYKEVLSVDWNTLASWWDSIAQRVASEAEDFKTFVTGSLPQAGMALLGLVAGFKRR